jgi:hypothetical protein
VIDDELPPPFEQVEQPNFPVRPVERVVLLDPHHRQAAAFGVQGILRFRRRLLLDQEFVAGPPPFFAGDNLWEGGQFRFLLGLGGFHTVSFQ